MKNKYIWTGIIIAAVLILDQWTKLLVMEHIPFHGTVTVIPGFFDLTNVRNPGAAFGFLSGNHGAWRTALFVTVAVAALGVIAFLLRSTQDRLQAAAYSLIAGGAVGNLVDRVRLGEVVDFVDWYIGRHHWPAFNIADAGITLGVALMVVDMLFFHKEQDTAKTA